MTVDDPDQPTPEAPKEEEAAPAPSGDYEPPVAPHVTAEPEVPVVAETPAVPVADEPELLPPVRLDDDLLMEVSPAEVAVPPPLPEQSKTTGSRKWRIAGILVALAAWAGGVFWRYKHIFFIRKATDYVYSDMKGYVRRATNLFNTDYHENITDTLFPPGAHYWFGYLYRMDDTWHLAMTGQFILSCMVPVILMGIAWELYGRKAALLVLAMASLYYPFIDYFAFFLSEGPFMFAMLLSLWLTIRVVKTRRLVFALPLGLLTGLVIGGAASIRGVALIPVAFVGLALMFAAIKHRNWRLGVKLVPLAIGLSVVMAALAARCTKLNEDQFCLVSTNGGMNVLLGHYGGVRGVKWRDKKRNYTLTFGTPVNKQRGYTADYEFDFGVYDQKANMAKAMEYTREHPWHSFLLGVDHVFDLFTGTMHWPQVGTPSKRDMITFQHLFLLFLLLPALIHCVQTWRSWKALDGPALGDLLFVLCMMGLMVTAFIAHGSPRIRVPFDGFIMLLAARAYLKGRTEGAGLRVGAG